MTRKDWIIKKLEENNGDTHIVSTLYPEYQKEFGVNVSKPSFIRMISMYSNIDSIEEINVSIPDKFVESYDDFSRDLIIEAISNYIKTNKEKPTMKKLSSSTNIPVGALLQYTDDFNDFKNIVNTIYQENMFHIKDDVKVQKLKSQIVLLQKENKFLKTNEMTKNLLLEVINDVATVFTPIKKPSVIKKDPKPENIVAELLFSDAHFGDIVKKEQVIVNQYNPEIAKIRIDKLFNQTLDYCKLIGTHTLDINILGDMISGRIHEEILQNTAFTTAEAVIKLADYIAKWIDIIVKEGYIIDNVRCIVGNHGRMTSKPNFDNKSLDNFEWFLYEFLKRSIGDIVNNFEMPQSIVHIADVFETRLGLLHGDILKGGTGLNPVSGTWGRDAAKLNSLFNSQGVGFNILCFGHFHSGEMLLSGFDKTKIVVNGSVKGTDSFSIGAVKTGARPNQTIFCIEKGRKGQTQFFQTLFLD